MPQKKCMLLAASISLALVLSACAGRPLQGVLIPEAQSAEGTSRIDMLVATTRQRATADAGEMFNGERAENVSYANIVVSIPPDSAREIGKISVACIPPGQSCSRFRDRFSGLYRQAATIGRRIRRRKAGWTQKCAHFRARVQQPVR